jgi:hypothetical protein
MFTFPRPAHESVRHSTAATRAASALRLSRIARPIARHTRAFRRGFAAGRARRVGHRGEPAATRAWSWRDDQSSAARITEVRPTAKPTIQPATSWPTSTAPRTRPVSCRAHGGCPQRSTLVVLPRVLLRRDLDVAASSHRRPGLVPNEPVVRLRRGCPLRPVTLETARRPAGAGLLDDSGRRGAVTP